MSFLSPSPFGRIVKVFCFRGTKKFYNIFLFVFEKSCTFVVLTSG